MKRGTEFGASVPLWSGCHLRTARVGGQGSRTVRLYGGSENPPLPLTRRRRLADVRASARRYRTRIRFPDRDRARPPSAAAAPAAAAARPPGSARGDTTRSPCPLG